MTRSEMLAAAAATVAAGAQERKAQSDAPRPALLGLRYVVPIGPFRVGVLDSAGVAVIEHPEVAPTRLNLPRATPEVYRWVRTRPPSTPYIHPAQTIGDVIRGSEPDEVTVAVAIMPYVILGVSTFAEELPRGRMPSFSHSDYSVYTGIGHIRPSPGYQRRRRGRVSHWRPPCRRKLSR